MVWDEDEEEVGWGAKIQGCRKAAAAAKGGKSMSKIPKEENLAIDA